MKKYWQIFKISFAQEFAYKASFIMWRVRNVLQILIFFFLWDAVFRNGTDSYFGYNRTKIFTYAFSLIIVRAIVLSSRSIDVAGQISKGDLTNLLLKPVNFFKYWLTRDVGSKFLNISFGIFEVSLLLILLKPPIFIQTNIIYLLFFFLSLIIASFIFFNLTMLTSFVPFWAPETAWGAQFLVSVIIEFLSGAFFPIDIFPSGVYNVLTLMPFSYLIFVPIKIYLGSFSYSMMFQSLAIGIIWSLILWKTMNNIWKKGLLVYEGVGR